MIEQLEQEPTVQVEVESKSLEMVGIRGLASAIILQAFKDLTSKNVDDTDKMSAIQFLTIPNETLDMCCGLAHISMDCIIKRSKQALESGETISWFGKLKTMSVNGNEVGHSYEAGI